MPTLRSDTLELAYTVDGPADGFPVLLLHGWPDAARGWRQLAPALHARSFRTVIPDLRGSGATRFHSPGTPRDGQAAALTQDALDLADGLGLDRFAVVGHDWGARLAYSLAALVPERVSAIAALALPFQPGARFTMPDFEQARAFWYQWLMYVDAGAEAVRRDPIGFARVMWETWSPAGWFDPAEFAETARSFENPDWVPITLNAYRARFNTAEPRDERYDLVRARLAEAVELSVPTLMIQGAADACDRPEGSAGLDRHFTGGYRREVLDGVGHFPHREAPEQVARLVVDWLTSHR